MIWILFTIKHRKVLLLISACLVILLLVPTFLIGFGFYAVLCAKDASKNGEPYSYSQMNQTSANLNDITYTVGQTSTTLGGTSMSGVTDVGGSVNASEAQVESAIEKILGQDLSYNFFVHSLKDTDGFTSTELHNMYEELVPSICAYLKYGLFPSLTICESGQESSYGTAVPNEWNWWGLGAMYGNDAYWQGTMGDGFASFDNLYDGCMYHALWFTQSNYDGGSATNWLHLTKAEGDVLKQTNVQDQIRALASSPYCDGPTASDATEVNGVWTNTYYTNIWAFYQEHGFSYWTKVSEELKASLEGKSINTNPASGGNPYSKSSSGSYEPSTAQPNQTVTVDGNKDKTIGWGLVAPVAPNGNGSWSNFEEFDESDSSDPKGYSPGYYFRTSKAEPVYASAAGTIDSVESGYINISNNTSLDEAEGSSGNGLEIVETLEDGQINLVYSHLGSSCVKAGQTVKQGQVIGETGTSGNAKGIGVDFEIEDFYNDSILNPMVPPYANGGGTSTKAISYGHFFNGSLPHVSGNESQEVQNILAYARKFLGYPYVWGDNGPNAFDCSGFVQYVFKHFGIDLTRTTYTQVNQGTKVAIGDEQPGDLIFEIGSASSPDHVGIYIGNGEIINAMDPQNGVTISPLYEVVAVRDVLNV